MNYPYNNPYNYRYTPTYPNPYNVTPLPYIQPEPTQQTAQPGLRGVLVQAENQITADNVPMDGSVAFFPMQDMSVIYAKKWNADGTIQTMTFKPVSDTQKNTITTTMPTGDLAETVSKLSNQIDRLEAVVGRLKTKSFNGRKDETV